MLMFYDWSFSCTMYRQRLNLSKFIYAWKKKTYHLPCCGTSVRNINLQHWPVEVGRRSGSLWVWRHRIPPTTSYPRGCGKWAFTSLPWSRSHTSSVKFSCSNKIRHALCIAWRKEKMLSILNTMLSSMSISNTQQKLSSTVPYFSTPNRLRGTGKIQKE